MNREGLIGKFAPVDNDFGFDIRGFDVIDGKAKNFTWLQIRSVPDIELLPEFKPIKHCRTRKEFDAQFITDEITNS